jgi:hypothetical protein
MRQDLGIDPGLDIGIEDLEEVGEIRVLGVRPEIGEGVERVEVGVQIIVEGDRVEAEIAAELQRLFERGGARVQAVNRYRLIL